MNKFIDKIFWIFLIVLVIFRVWQTQPDYKQGDRVRITTVVSSEPIKYETSQYIKIAGLTTYLPLFPEIGYGDKVIVEGFVDEKKLKNPELIFLEKSNAILVGFRGKLVDFLRFSLPEPHSSLVGELFWVQSLLFQHSFGTTSARQALRMLL